MSVFIKEISFKGIKNLKDKTIIQFSKKDIKKFSEVSGNNIKAIYGPNGSGKTAIVHGFDILKSLVVINNYLQDSDHTMRLYELLNKANKDKQIDLSISFLHADDNQPIKNYNYHITLTCVNQSFEITYEKFSVKDNEYATEKVIFEVVDAVIKQYNLKYEKTVFTNLLNKRTLPNILLSIYSNFDNNEDDNKKIWLKDIETIDALYSLIFDTKVILDDKNEHQTVVSPSSHLNFTAEQFIDMRNQNIKDIKLGVSTKVVKEYQLKMIKSEKTNKEKFLKVFKPSIKRIEIKEQLKVKHKIKGSDLYTINEFIDYGDFKLDTEFESIGIKKLLSLYDAIKHLQGGGIAVIDELDSHINDIYLIKLIEYISEFTKGQLIFTTHNVSPMDILKSKKYSIDFMAMNGKVTSWTQVGNYSPSKLYQKGMISGLPFNLKKEDFLSVFDNES